MEGNRGEAEKCIELAEYFLSVADVRQGRKYLATAERLYPSQRAKDLLSRLASSDSDSPDSESDEPASEGGSGSPPGRDGAGQQAPASDAARHQPKYSSEQLHAVKQVQSCRDYYEMLGVERDCSDDDLKRAYKRLALKFHPDKNLAPGATDAFKTVMNALAVLSDPVKRRSYNQHGVTEDVSSAQDFQYSASAAASRQSTASKTSAAFKEAAAAKAERDFNNFQTNYRAHFYNEFAAHFDDPYLAEELYRQFFDISDNLTEQPRTYEFGSRPRKQWTRQPPFYRPQPCQPQNYRQSSQMSRASQAQPSRQQPVPSRQQPQLSRQQPQPSRQQPRTQSAENSGSSGNPRSSGLESESKPSQHPRHNHLHAQRANEAAVAMTYALFCWLMVAQSRYAFMLDISPLLFIATLFFLSTLLVKDL